jgi:protein-tyrosine phosphatase
LEKYYVRGGLGLPGGGLLQYYELQGLTVRHKSLTDYQRPTAEEMRHVLEEFDQLPTPVLLHCSAGIDRTTPVAAFLVEQRGGGADAD